MECSLLGRREAALEVVQARAEIELKIKEPRKERFARQCPSNLPSSLFKSTANYSIAIKSKRVNVKIAKMIESEKSFFLEIGLFSGRNATAFPNSSTEEVSAAAAQT